MQPSKAMKHFFVGQQSFPPFKLPYISPNLISLMTLTTIVDFLCEGNATWLKFIKTFFEFPIFKTLKSIFDFFEFIWNSYLLLYTAALCLLWVKKKILFNFLTKGNSNTHIV